MRSAAIAVVTLLNAVRAASPWSQYIPAGFGGGSAGGSAGGGSPMSQYGPVSLPRKPALGLAAEVNSTCGERTFTLRFESSSSFSSGFVGSVVVEPWTRDLLVQLNYSRTDVNVQRLWNGDIVDGAGKPVAAYDLLTGKGGQAYGVKLHNASVASSASAPPDSVSFMAQGTAQPPEMSVIGCASIDDDGADGGSELGYEQGTTWPGGFVAAVIVRPWTEGELLALDFTSSPGVSLSHLTDATVERADGGSHLTIVRLGNLTVRTGSDGMRPPSSFAIQGFGTVSAPPKISRLLRAARATPAQSDGHVHSRAGRSGLRQLVMAAAFALGSASAVMALGVYEYHRRRVRRCTLLPDHFGPRGDVPQPERPARGPGGGVARAAAGRWLGFCPGSAAWATMAASARGVSSAGAGDGEDYYSSFPLVTSG